MTWVGLIEMLAVWIAVGVNAWGFLKGRRLNKALAAQCVALQQTMALAEAACEMAHGNVAKADAARAEYQRRTEMLIAALDLPPGAEIVAIEIEPYSGPDHKLH